MSSWKHRILRDTCSLFPLFGDPWPSCLLPSQYQYPGSSADVCSRSGFCRLPQHDMTGILSTMYTRFVNVASERRKGGRENLGPILSSVQFSSVAQSCLTLCDPMNRSTPGLPVYHHLLEFTQIHVHRVRDAIQPSHPRSSPSPAPNPSQHQSLFQ